MNKSRARAHFTKILYTTQNLFVKKKTAALKNQHIYDSINDIKEVIFVTKRAFVLAGGGSRGAYQIGVWQAMRKLNIDFDIVTGTSVGALNGAMVVQGDFEFARKLWEEISTSKVLDVDIEEKLENQKNVAKTLNAFAQEMLRAGGVDPAPLEAILKEHIDEEKIKNSDIDFAIVTVEYPGFNPCIVKKDDLKDKNLIDYLMASSSCFPAMKMRNIDGKKYIDGGYYDNMPIKLAIDMGADEIIAVDLDGIGITRPFDAESTKITHIKSYWNLGVFLLFESAIARQNMRLGYLDGLKYLGGYEGMAYTFYKGECQKIDETGLGTFTELLNRAENSSEPQYVNKGLLSVAKNAVFRALTKKKRRSSLKINNLVAAAEIAAEIFAVTPLKIYTAEQFRKEILNSYEEYRDSMTEPELIFSEQSVQKAVENISKALSSCGRTVFCVKKISEYLKTGQELSSLTALAAIMPQEFLAAVYIVSLL